MNLLFMMTPAHFPQANATFTAPPGLDESQVCSIPACRVTMRGGNMDGADAVIVAWKPDAEDLARLNAGALVYLGSLGGLCPHFMATQFPG
jgi:hypothetical protein